MSIHKTVVRNQGYTRGAVEFVERHNERKNASYGNEDVATSQSYNNVHFKVCDGTYLGVFNKMVKDGEISVRGLKLNANGAKPESSVIAEMVFDVNTEYFDSQYESHGYSSGYEFAKAFYAEAYKMAVSDIGGEQYVLSATMHADERNKGLSERTGRDVYHYHLHVVYIPVVKKEVYYQKNNKNPELAGKLKEVINQVNHSKKWESEKETGEDGKERLVYSYSKLQDRYYDHMKAAGFKGFERGKAGSTAEHLAVLDYKLAIRKEELAAVDRQLAQSKNSAKRLYADEQAIRARIKRIEGGGQKLTPKQLEKIQTRVYAPLVGAPGIILSYEDEKNLRATAASAATARDEADKRKAEANAAVSAVKDVVQAVGLLNFNFKSDRRPADNLTPDQEILLAAIRRRGIDFANTHGHKKSADEMKKAAMSKPMAELFNVQEKEYIDKHKPSILEALSKKEDGRSGDSPERSVEQNAEQIHGRKTHASTR